MRKFKIVKVCTTSLGRFRLVSLSFALTIMTNAGLVGCDRLTHPSAEQVALHTMKATADGLTKESLHIRYFGATTIQIDDGNTALMIDGFFSRPGLAQVLFGEISPDIDRINYAFAKGDVGNLAAVLVAHSHYDHAMDSAFVAVRTNAVLVGSKSTAKIGQGQGLPDNRIVEVNHRDKLRYGDFIVEIFESPHSADPWFSEDIDQTLQPPARVGQYRAGRNYSFLIRHQWGTVLIHPSANFSPKLFENIKADVVFLSLGMLGSQSECFAEEYWRSVVLASKARFVVPIHWDDLLRPLDEPLLPMPYLVDDFTGGYKTLLRMGERDGISIQFMPLFQPFDLKAFQ